MINCNKKIFCCFSKPLRDYLAQNKIKYEICALNPNSKLMFWAYIKDDKLNKCLKDWSLKNN